jgi:hypothetical protein
MQQMMETMLARMDANTKSSQEDLLEKMDAMMDANRNAFREEMAIFGADGKETMSCQVKKEACLDSKGLNPEDMESEAEHREIPTEGSAVKSSGTMKKRHKGRHLAAGRRGEPKELTRGDC